MNKIKLLTALVIALVIINLLALGALMWGPPHHRGHRPGPDKRVKKMIIKDLKLDKMQIEAYQILVDNHQTKLRAKEAELRETQQKLYALLSVDNQNTKEVLMQKTAQLHQEIVAINFDHFMEIKDICQPDQLDEFNALSERFVHLFHPSPPKKHKKRK